jgi:hypothetical protein
MRGVGLALVCLCTMAGCNVNTGIAPVEPTIKTCAKRDFGFVGKWQVVRKDRLHDRDPAPVAEIKFDADKDRFFVSQLSGYDDLKRFEVSFRTADLELELPYAIVEIEVTSPEEKGTLRRLAVAGIQDDKLALYCLSGKELAELMYQEEVGAVIERSSFSTSVRCKPEGLLRVVRKHSKQLVGEPEYFQRIKVTAEQP